MAVTAVTITSGPTVVGRSVTLSGTLNRDGGGTNNNINFLVYDVGYANLYTIARLQDGSAGYGAQGTAGTGIPWTWTGALPEGDYLAVTVNLSEAPYTTLATSSTNIGLIQLRKPLAGIWTPQRDSRGLFVERFQKPPSYKDTWNGFNISQYRRTFYYPTSDGRVYWSAVDNIGREGEYGLLPKPAYTPHGPGLDVPQGWEWSTTRYGGTNTPGGYSTSTIVYVSVFHIHNASVYVDNATMTYPGLLGPSRYNRSEVFAYWSNSNGEQSIRFGTGGFQSDSLQNISVDGVGNGLHCLVVLQRSDTSTNGHRVYLDGKLVGAATGLYSYLGALDLRPYAWGGSISQSHLNIGNILFQGSIDKFYPTDEQAAEISRDPYRLFFRDAPSIKSKLSLRQFFVDIPVVPTPSGGKLAPKKWDKQPTTFVRIDPANSINQGILHAGTPHHDVFDAVEPLSWISATRPPIGTGRAGLYWASYPYSQFATPSPYNLEAVDQTALWVVSAEYDTYTGTFPAVKGPSGGDNSGTGIGINVDGNIVYFGGYQSVLLDSGVKIPLRQTSIIIVTSSTADGTKIYLNGNLIASTATAYLFYDGYYNTLNRSGYIDAYGNYITVQGRQAYPIFTYGVAQWKRALTLSEVKSLSNNPWQIYQVPKRQLFFSPLPSVTTGFKGGTFLPQRWRQQPQTNLTVDWGHSLARNLCSVWHPAVSQYIGPGLSPSPTPGTFSYQADSTGGYGVRFNGAANSRIALPAGSAGTSAGYSGTRLVLFRPYANFLGLVSGTVAGTIGMRLMAINSLALVSASNVLVGSGNIPVSSRPTVALCTANDTNNETRLHCNGQLLFTGSSIYGTSNAGLWVGAITNHNSDANFFLSLSWDRPLSLSESAAIQENPWQIFKPKSNRTYFIPGTRNRSRFLFLFY